MSPHQQLRSLHRQLGRAAKVVPRIKRETWQAEWVAELSHAYAQDPAAAAELAQGLVPDAIMMRRIHLQHRVEAIDWRSPEFCLRILLGAFAALAAGGLVQPHFRNAVFSSWGLITFAWFFTLAILTVPSTVVVSRFSAHDAYEGEAASMRQRAGRWYFLGAKLLLLVMSVYLLAVHLTLPLVHLIGRSANGLLIPCGLVFNVIVIGWAFNDQRERCPTCMRLLRSPARMGPPSWSLLDSNATEEMCDRGHGLLHQPEWQTSWCQNARWLQLDGTWRELFRP
ncbi:hypothetical protein Terro_3919 [Terriglobus roseus DSM 18391]|uniref:Uncharacterized protein n=1 Tax=Terriglobus roseus (strain DSM 18391 / NRRL B-41598 / KBS 63) TaxID=926566 RepID=I3ZLK9_TERRK|nr:hypothetical protein [Terriglobus roseus]AFL90127.1 hypothetical protein Terro_3919 [Terriglobus roseus DSM 18391]